MASGLYAFPSSHRANSARYRSKKLFMLLCAASMLVMLFQLLSGGLETMKPYHHGRKWWWKARKFLLPWEKLRRRLMVAPPPPPAPPPAPDTEEKVEGAAEGEKKKILLYTSFFGYKDWGGFGSEALSRCGRRARNCQVAILDEEEEGEGGREGAVARADAVLFHLVEMITWNRADLEEINRWRKQDQRFVVFNMESPLNVADRHMDLGSMRDFFNWTMTFRHDSDVYCPYGSVVRREEETPSSSPSWSVWANKTRSALWLVSNCHTYSARERYVGELVRRGLQVDVFGLCGEAECDKQRCDSTIANEYRFYLSFENSVCEDYVTEKFFRRLQDDILPVVLGGADYSRVSPPHSHLNVRDFSSPGALAEYLRHLERSQEEYDAYFEWKRGGSYHIVPDAAWVSVGLCNLCERLNDRTLPRKSYPDLEGWLLSSSEDGRRENNSRACLSADEFPWSTYQEYSPERGRGFHLGGRLALIFLLSAVALVVLVLLTMGAVLGRSRGGGFETKPK